MTETEVREIKDELAYLRQAVQELTGQVAKMTRPQPVILREHPNIVRVEDVQGGEPMIRGKYVPVSVIVSLIRQGLSAEDIVDEYEERLSLADVYDALSYYYTHQQEVDSYLTSHREALARV